MSMLRFKVTFLTTHLKLILKNFSSHNTPKVPEQPKEQPKEQSKEQPKEQPTNVPTTPTYTDKTLPKTGDEAPASLLALGTLILGGLGLASTKRRKED